MKIDAAVVAVTGAGRGIGRALVEHFAARGALIAALDIDERHVLETCERCHAVGAVARGYTVDVTDEVAVAAVMGSVVRDFGRLDVLINNAGIIRDGLLVKVRDQRVVGTLSLQHWNEVIGVNLTGTFLCGREAAARMVTLGHGGVIINISSISQAGNAGQTNYSARKAGVSAMAVTWAKELARFGIRAASIAPGFVATDLLMNMRPEVLEQVTRPVPLKRLGRPEEIARAAAFVVENDFFTGRCLEIDGGLRF